MRARRMLAVLAAAVALVASACGQETTPETQQLDVVARDFAFDGVPSTIRGGVVTATFRNEGQVDHEMAFVDIGDATLDDVKRDFPAFIEGGPFPDYFQRAVVPLEVEPGESVTTSFILPEGTYLLFCALDGDPNAEPEEGEEVGRGAPHYELGMFQENVRVEGGNGELSAPDGEIVARDYTFDIPELTGGDKELVFRNEGPTQWHHLILMEFPEGVGEEEAVETFRTFAELEEGQPPPEGTPEPEEVGFTGIFSPGGGQTFEVTLQSGRTYLAVCFIHDLEGGPPHAFAHDMFRVFTVG